MKKYIFTFFFSLFFIALHAQSRIFLKYEIPGIEGSSVVSGFTDQVEIFGLSYNVNNNVLSTSATPIVSQNSSPGFITFYNTINKSTFKTSHFFYKGDFLSKIVIKLTKEGPSNSLLIYCEITLEDSKIASIQNYGENMEKIQILANKFKVSYIPYNNIGQAQTPVIKGWDYVTNLANN